EVYAPKLALEHRCARRKAAADLGVSARELVPHLLRGMADRLPRRADGTGAVVREAIDKARLQIFEQRSVATEALARAALERVGEDLRMEAGHRPRPVGRVEEPGAGSGWDKRLLSDDGHRHQPP